MGKSNDKDRVRVVTHRILRCLRLTTDCAQELKALVPIMQASKGAKGQISNLLGSSTGNPKDLFERPLVDVVMMTVTWRGRTCRLKSQISLDILDRLARRPDHFVSFDRLLREVWNGKRSDDTIRSSIRHLKMRLDAGGLGDLGKAIRSFGRRYHLAIKPM